MESRIYAIFIFLYISLINLNIVPVSIHLYSQIEIRIQSIL